MDMASRRLRVRARREPVQFGGKPFALVFFTGQWQGSLKIRKSALCE